MLTPSQVAVVACAARGLTKLEIGLLLGVSENTVKSRLRVASERLGTSTVAHTVARCIHLGLIDAEGRSLAQPS